MIRNKFSNLRNSQRCFSTFYKWYILGDCAVLCTSQCNQKVKHICMPVKYKWIKKWIHAPTRMVQKLNVDNMSFLKSVACCVIFTTTSMLSFMSEQKQRIMRKMRWSVNKENTFVLPTATSHEPEVSGNITVTTGCGQRDPWWLTVWAGGGMWGKGSHQHRMRQSKYWFYEEYENKTWS